MVAIAHGNDMGGSIRFPASMCGLVGLKPTRARTTLGPDLGELWGPLTHEHVLTRTVRDTAGVLDAVAGPGPGDPYTAPPPIRPWRDEVGADPGRLRIGFRTLRCDGSGESHPDIVTAVNAAAGLLGDLGHHVEETPMLALDDPLLGNALGVGFAAVVAREVDRLGEMLGRPVELGELEPVNALQAEMGRSVTAAQWLAALEGMQLFSRRVAAWWADGNDVLLLPTSPEPPVPLGQLAPLSKDPMALLMDAGALITFTFPWNVTGQPAISLPLHWNDDGLPIGVQLVAAAGREDVLLRVAAQLEEARPWRDRRPPMAS
jgi:amidase